MREEPAAGLTLIDATLERGELPDYHRAHAARADLYRRLGRTADARASYEKALALTQQLAGSTAASASFHDTLNRIVTNSVPTR